MMDVGALERMGSGYVPLMVFACLLALVRGWNDTMAGQGTFANERQRFALFRAAGAIGIVHAGQHIIAALQPGIMLTWWQNMGIDFIGFMMVTAPPRFVAQAVIGACFGAMLVFDVVLGIAGEQFIRFHYLFSTLAGYIAFVTLMAWTIGVPPGARRRMDRVGRWLSRVVLSPLGKKPA